MAKDLDNAKDVIFREEYLPTFVKTAARLGFAPKTKEDIDDMLKIASTINALEAENPGVASQGNETLVKKAYSALAGLVSSNEQDVEPESEAAFEAAKQLVSTK